MPNADRIMEAIADAVAGAAREKRAVEVNALAIRLSSRYQQSGMTIDSICDHIMRDAGAAGVGCV